MRVGIKDIVKISLGDKDYEKLDMYYYGQIAAASVSPTTNPKPLSDARIHLEDNIKMTNISKMAQKSRQRKKTHFDIPIKPQSKKLEQKTT